MNTINIGLIGHGNVGSGVVKFLNNRKKHIQEKSQTTFVLKTICDLRIKDNPPAGIKGVTLTSDYHKILNDPDIDVIIELIGGLSPAKDIVLGALKNKKHVVTANKALIAQHGKELFRESHRCGRNIYFESAVMAGVPVIKTITEGIAGNQYNSLYGIINGTCNYILSLMRKQGCSFNQAVKLAQKSGFAETDPTLDINGMDSAYKLAILVSLAMGKFVTVKDIHTEGITDISHDDIQYAEKMGLTIKLLAIAKKVKNEIELRVHPTLISQEHPLASINGVHNALYMSADPLGNVMISGEGAGQMAAATGIISDLINLASRAGCEASQFLGNSFIEKKTIKIKKMDLIQTKFYIRFMAIDKPGVLSKISGILGQYGIGINSVSQKIHNRASIVPVIMLTDYAPEKKVRAALDKIHKLSIVKSKPVAIRMEKLT